MARTSTALPQAATTVRAPDAAMLQRAKGMGATDAAWKKQQAAEERAFAVRMGAVEQCAAIEKADRLEAEAAAILDIGTHTASPPTVGSGGEMTTADTDMHPHVNAILEHPDMLAVDASRHRLSLVSNAGVLPLALDVAETVQARDSLEKMLAHQIAAAHSAALLLQAEAMSVLKTYKSGAYRHAHLDVEAVRLINASSRMMEASQRGMLTLNRLRTSGRQTLVVQHVHIGDGGQAVVAGQIKANGRRKRTAGGG
jgi:hypothetical protein